VFAALIAVVIGTMLPVLPSGVAHADRSRTTITVNVPDSIVVDVPDVPAPPAPPGTVRKRIVIGGSGVRIQDEGTAAESDSNDVNFEFDFDVDAEDTGEDIVRVGESVFVAAHERVAGDVVVFGGNAIIEGTVAGSVVVLGGEIRVRRGAEIKGDIVSIGGTIEEDEEVVIRGEKILVGGVATRLGDRLDVSTRTIRAAATIALLFIGFILFFITMLFLRGRVERVSEHVVAGMLRCFGAGVLTSVVGLFALLIVMIPLIITIVGIPLAVVLAVSCIGVYVIACTTFVYTVGRAVGMRAGIDGAFVRLFLGIAVLFVPEIIAFVIDATGGPMPAYVLLKVVSAFLWMFAFVVGLGAIVNSRFGARPAHPTPPASRVVGEPAGAPVA
jgi:hypothetical protein